jgi:YbbR domain-containing protein
MKSKNMLNWLISNLKTFLLACIMAVAVWVSAVTAADPDEVRVYPRAIPLEILGQDPRLVIVGSLPERVNVTIRAPRSTWEQLTSTEGQVRALLDLSGLEAGQHRLQVQLQVVSQPARVVSVTPQTLDINLELLATKVLPIQLSIRGEPAVGYEAGTLRITPQEVNISGPQSKVEQVVDVRSDLNIAGVRQDVQSTLTLRLLDANGLPVNGLTVRPESAQVFIPITQQGGYRDIAVKVNVRGQVAAGYRLTTVSVFPPVLTVYSQDPALVKDLPGFVETEPLNLNGAAQDIDTRLPLILPRGVSIVGEQTVRVQVGIDTIEGSLSLNDVGITVVGLAPGLEAVISPERLDIILTGPLPLLDKLTAGDVRFFVDLTGLPIGTHQVVPQAEIFITDIEVQSLNPATVEVIIRAKETPTPNSSP